MSQEDVKFMPWKQAFITYLNDPNKDLKLLNSVISQAYYDVDIALKIWSEISVFDIYNYTNIKTYMEKVIPIITNKLYFIKYGNSIESMNWATQQGATAI